MNRDLAICVATYRRPELLRRLLDSLLAAVRDSTLHAPDVALQVRVVDNDPNGSAEPHANHFAQRASIDVLYLIEPEQNIALARNRAIEAGPADLIAFIDDDEVVEPNWINHLVSALDESGADAVFGPVAGILPWDAPGWMRRSGWFDKRVPSDGLRLDWTGTRTSNTLVCGHWFYAKGFRFDPAFGRSGGSDTALFARMQQAGARYHAAPHAWVYEEVEPDRLNVRWLARRRFRGGLVHHRIASATGVHQPQKQAMRRTARLGLELMKSVPGLALGRWEDGLRPVLTASQAWGGIVAWLSPQQGSAFVEYGTRNEGAA